MAPTTSHASSLQNINCPIARSMMAKFPPFVVVVECSMHTEGRIDASCITPSLPPSFGRESAALKANLAADVFTKPDSLSSAFTNISMKASSLVSRVERFELANMLRNTHSAIICTVSFAFSSDTMAMSFGMITLYCFTNTFRCASRSIIAWYRPRGGKSKGPGHFMMSLMIACVTANGTATAGLLKDSVKDSSAPTSSLLRHREAAFFRSFLL
mmetsp:Transcript_21395/g.34521  ORF Transcript_21395/g.34521 Transcript_21395/m.34521 type:complete len:214 (-) Transcript_21395:234-875(-)